MHPSTIPHARPLRVQLPEVTLPGAIVFPATPVGLVLLIASEAGLPASAPPASLVAALLASGLAVLQLDLLTPEEQREDKESQHLRFNMALLAARVEQALLWLARQPETRGLPVAGFGAGLAGGGLLRAAAARPELVRAIALWNARPDMVGRNLAGVHAPCLLLVGEASPALLGLNRSAAAILGGEPRLVVVPRDCADPSPHVGAWLRERLADSLVARTVGG